ncbi:MAG: hypothetical protein AAFQ84_09665 [Pseudomonadota bacterium]
MALIRFLAACLSLVLILAGLVAMLAPTPFGFVIVGLGLVLLGWSAPGAVRWIRRRWLWLDRQCDRLQASGPGWLARLLALSDP